MTDITNLTSAKGLYDLTLFVSQATDGVFFVLFVILLFIILTLSLKRFETTTSIWISSLITFVVTLILAYMQLLGMVMVLPFLTIFILTGFWKTISK